MSLDMNNVEFNISFSSLRDEIISKASEMDMIEMEFIRKFEKNISNIK